MGLISIGILKLPVFNTNPEPVMMLVDPHHREVMFDVSFCDTHIDVKSKTLKNSFFPQIKGSTAVYLNKLLCAKNQVLSYTKQGKIS